MKAVIIEDEIIASQNLQRLIAQVNKDIEIIAILKSIEDSVEWFSLNPNPDLVFMDIHLSDGASFSIFEKVLKNHEEALTKTYLPIKSQTDSKKVLRHFILKAACFLSFETRKKRLKA
jgi:two-component system LytT family response regulator